MGRKGYSGSGGRWRPRPSLSPGGRRPLTSAKFKLNLQAERRGQGEQVVTNEPLYMVRITL